MLLFHRMLVEEIITMRFTTTMMMNDRFLSFFIFTTIFFHYSYALTPGKLQTHMSQKCFPTIDLRCSYFFGLSCISPSNCVFTVSLFTFSFICTHD